MPERILAHGVPRTTLAHLLSILSSALVGVVLIVAPWTPFWDANSLIHPHLHIKQIVLSGHFRGAVSGLGMVNLFVALLEIAKGRRPSDGRS